MTNIVPFCQQHEACHCMIASMHVKVHNDNVLIVLHQLVHSILGALAGAQQLLEESESDLRATLGTSGAWVHPEGFMHLALTRIACDGQDLVVVDQCSCWSPTHPAQLR